MNLVCPSCNRPIGSRHWQPYNVAGSLTIACACRCGHRWQINRVEVIIPPPGPPPETIPLAWAPVDVSDI